MYKIVVTRILIGMGFTRSIRVLNYNSGTRSKRIHSRDVLWSPFSHTIDNLFTFIRYTITKISSSSTYSLTVSGFRQHVVFCTDKQKSWVKIMNLQFRKSTNFKSFLAYQDFYVTVRYNKNVYVLHRKFWHFSLVFTIDF